MNEKSWTKDVAPAEFIENAKNFQDLIMQYRCAIREVQTKLEVLDDEFSVEYKRNPISFIKTRIKKPQSILISCKEWVWSFLLRTSKSI